MTCPHGDIYCPCQEGAACHYEGVGALPSPRALLEPARCPRGHAARRPAWSAVESAARVVAARWSLTPDAVLYGDRRCDRAARATAFREVIAITGCSIAGLADVWGISRKSIQTALRREQDTWRRAA